MRSDCVTARPPDPDLAGLGDGLVCPIDDGAKVIRRAVRLTEEGYSPIEFLVPLRPDRQAGRLESWIRRGGGGLDLGVPPGGATVTWVVTMLSLGVCEPGRAIITVTV